MSTLYKSEPSEIMLCMPPFGFFKTEKNKGDMQMAFAIMRCKKIKTPGGVASSLQHCFRERKTHNADPEKLTENKHGKGLADNVDSAMGKMRERLPLKRRKDAVLMVEYMMTASPEWFKEATEKDQKDFFNLSYNWLCDKYGRENVIVATIHNDETTPHMSAFVTPVTNDGRLSAKEFIGNKKKMSDDQTTYAEKVAHLGLNRGIKGSKAKHQSIRQYYNLVNENLVFKAIKPEDLKRQKLKKEGVMKILPFSMFEESDKDLASRLSEKVRKAYAVASNLRDIERKAESYRDVAIKSEKEKEGLKKELFKQNLSNQGLTKEQLQKIEEIKSMMKAQNEEKEKLRKLERNGERKGFKR